MLGRRFSVRVSDGLVNPILKAAQQLQLCTAGGAGMNKVASTTWWAILVLVAIVIAALMLYNN